MIRNISVILLNRSSLAAFPPLFVSMKNTPQLEAITSPGLAERTNGWAAMLGFVAAVGAYATTGQIIPGVF